MVIERRDGMNRTEGVVQRIGYWGVHSQGCKFNSCPLSFL